jgi:hypothetical protein
VSRLDPDTLWRFVTLASERLVGDWVVIGGCVLPLLGIPHRATLDIDIAGPDDTDMGQLLVLMEIAEELGLPVETINQAGSHFLRRIEDWADHLVVLRRGKRATIHVPDATLFILLKTRRLTESDLLDCAKMIGLVRQREDALDTARVRGAVQEALEGAPPGGRRERLGRLLAMLERRP